VKPRSIIISHLTISLCFSCLVIKTARPAVYGHAAAEAIHDAACHTSSNRSACGCGHIWYSLLFATLLTNLMISPPDAQSCPVAHSIKICIHSSHHHAVTVQAPEPCCLEYQAVLWYETAHFQLNCISSHPALSYDPQIRFPPRWFNLVPCSSNRLRSVSVLAR